MIVLRYLMREVMVSMFAVSFSLMLIVVSGRLVRLLSMAASGNIAGDVLFWMLLYRMPSFLELILPLGLFLGILLAYGRLYVESEMTVLSACGVSTRKLASYTMVSALVVAVLVGFVSLYVTPAAWQKARDISDDPRNSEGINTLVAGRFKTYGDGSRVSYTRSLNETRTEMENVFIATRIPEENRQGRVQVILADKGRIRADNDNDIRYMELDNGRRYVVTPGHRDAEITRFGTLGQRIDERDRDIAQRPDIDSTPTAELIQRDDLEAVAALQWRIALPVTVPIVAIIALAMSRTNHRKGRYSKMLPAVILYLLYLVLMSTIRSGIEDGKISSTVGFWPLHGVFLSIGLFLLYVDRVQMALKRWRR
ncbi:MAG TPA: LPS export ABC transporter permease LptF [Pseudomonadales bacterium]|nr:LPS export ABC transporter permease LptF [Pseudomonadales bacterium]